MIPEATRLLEAVTVKRLSFDELAWCLIGDIEMNRLFYQHKGEKMKRDIWIEHVEKAEIEKEKAREKATELRAKKIAKTKCDNCGKLGAKRVWFGKHEFDGGRKMHGFDRNLCAGCGTRLTEWRNYRAPGSG